MRSESAAVPELGGERGFAQRLPCHGGDAPDIGTVVGTVVGGTVAGRVVRLGRAPRRVRRAEQPGGRARLPVECSCPGQPGKGLRHGLRVAEFLRGGQALGMP